jgi:AraC-like DNA-binding protein
MKRDTNGAAAQQVAKEPKRLMLLHIVNRRINAGTEPLSYHTTECYTLAVVISGSGHCDVDGQVIPLHKGELLLLAPGCKAKLAAGHHSLHLYLIAVRISSMAMPGSLSQPNDRLPIKFVAHGACAVASTIAQLAMQLHSEQAASAGASYLQAQSQLLGCIECLLNPDETGAGAYDSEQLVKQTIAYIHQHYGEPLTVKQLAEYAHLEQRQYTRLFHKLTGSTPLDYLTECRLNRAKELLMLTDDQVIRIAHKSGYRDEYYFNRRFKEVVGVSPGRYGRGGASYKRICAMQFIGELLELGLQPLAAPRGVLAPYEGCVHGIVELSEERCMEELDRLRPDLVIAPDFLDADLVSCLERHAPIIMLKWDRSPFERLAALAASLGREAQAERWLAAYCDKQSAVRQLAVSQWQAPRKAAVLGMDEQGIWLFATRFFPTFYEAVGYEPVAYMKQMLQQQPHTRLVILDDHQLSLLADADHVFIVYKSKVKLYAALDRLAGNPAWQMLPAVAGGNLTVLGPRWASYDASTLNWQLDEIRSSPELAGLAVN